MRPEKVRIQGFRRLANTGCNITPRILAFVGQNEAGKSSLLKALTWATEEGQTALAREDQSRANRINPGWIVHLHYLLDEADQTALAGLGFRVPPTRFEFWKSANGRSGSRVPDGSRDPAPFKSAGRLLAAAVAQSSIDWAATTDRGKPAQWASSISPLLLDPNREWSDSEREDLDALCQWLASAPERTDQDGTGDASEEEPPGDPRDAAAALAIGLVRDLVGGEHPREAAKEILLGRLPRFVQFEERYRSFPTHTAFDAQSHLSTVAPTITNLLRIAGIEKEAIEEARRFGDDGEMRTVTSEGNKRLRAFFSQAWNQSGVTVEFLVKENTLECLIHETEHGRYTNLEERSDGLRAFIALAAFIEAQNLEVPPVLLIDEAETHLHIDAQADLVSALLGQLNATQVIYTTHSPGCLPSDLGTCIRLVAPDPGPGSTSSLRSDFWTNTGAGLSPLLYAMGASAAAFSVCRRAVLAEGASEMVLLPTLLRFATGLDDLDYQVVQGLAQANLGEDDLDGLAARVLYLVDGDPDGDTYRDRLIATGVQPERVMQLPTGWALEDLLDPEYVLATMARLRPSAVPLPTLSAIEGDGPILFRLAQWARVQEPKVDLASKMALAYAVVEDEERKLKPNAVECLKGLHEQFTSEFSKRVVAVQPAPPNEEELTGI